MQSKLRLIAFIGTFIVIVLAVGLASAAQEETAKPDWFFHDIVDVAYVQQHVTVPLDENVMIIDARPKQAKFDRGHIPMAVSIPNTYFDKMTDRLPKDKKALLIFYCGGPACKLSHKSAVKAEALGYTNVKVFADGFPGWMKVKGHYASVSTEWMKTQIDKGADMVVVDARPRITKYDKGHIPTAISIPDTQFDKFKSQLPQDKNKMLVFYCGGFKCKLSHKSAEKALAMGYTNVKVYAAGYPAWKAMAGDSATAQAGSPAKMKAGPQEGSIDIELFKKIVAENPESILLVDVRDKDEFDKGSLKTAVNIPVDELESKINSLPTDKPIVFVCGTGARSGEGYYMLQDLRPELKNVYYLDAEMTIHKDGTCSLKKPV
jgi:rhodanese-related sulfurtransferase